MAGPYQVQALPYPLVPTTQVTAAAIGTAQNLGTLPSSISYPAGSSVQAVNVDYWIIQEITVANSDAANSHTVNIYDVSSAGAASAANLIATIPVAAGRSVNPGFSTVVAPGHSLYAWADAASEVNVKVSGSALVG